jgi:hypothetical protein
LGARGRKSGAALAAEAVRDQPVVQCTFCGKGEREAVRLVASSDWKTFICNECVEACRELLQE